MKIYIASALPNLSTAREWAEKLRAAGHEVTSTWHDDADNTVGRELFATVREQCAIAGNCLREVVRSDVMVWLHGNAHRRVGAAVEFGYAMANGVRVYSHSLDGQAAPSVFGALCVPVADVDDLIARLP